MTRPVRYQKGELYQEYGAWFVRYRERVQHTDGSIKFRRRAKRLGDVESFPRADDIEPLRVGFMQKINHDRSNGDSSMTLAEFVDCSYLPWIEAERRASTSKGYRELWENHISARIGELGVREVRTVHVSRMLRAIAAEYDLAKNTLLRPLSISAPPITSELATVRPRISEFAAGRTSHPWYEVSIHFIFLGPRCRLWRGSRVLKTSQKSGSKKVQCGCPPVAP